MIDAQTLYDLKQQRGNPVASALIAHIEALEARIFAYFDVPPEHESEPFAFHKGWELCARSIAAYEAKS